MAFSEYFIIALIIKIKVIIELLNYKVIIKIKVIKNIKLVISLLKLINIIIKIIALITSKLIKFS